jgi:hypothetical protein
MLAGAQLAALRTGLPVGKVLLVIRHQFAIHVGGHHLPGPMANLLDFGKGNVDRHARLAKPLLGDQPGQFLHFFRHRRRNRWPLAASFLAHPWILLNLRPPPHRQQPTRNHGILLSTPSSHRNPRNTVPAPDLAAAPG